MALPTFEEFKRRYPKFGNVPEAMFARAMADAALYVDPVAFGVRYERAIEVKAAAILEGEKYGQTAPLNSKSENSEFAKQWEELCKLVPIKGMVL